MPDQTLNEKIVERINKTGFPLQIGLEHSVKNEDTGWRVGSQEHHWKNNRTGEEGWADLVLEKKQAVLVLECKRAMGGRWVFLQDEEHRSLDYKCRVLRNRRIAGFIATTEAAEISLSPNTHQAMYCIGAGDGKSDGRELLEHTAALVLSATEAIARDLEESVIVGASERNYYSAIVTNAELHVAVLDPSMISLQDGTIADAKMESVPYLRFTKQLWSGEDYPAVPSNSTSLRERNRTRLHTILIVNASHFIPFLRKFSPSTEGWD